MSCVNGFMTYSLAPASRASAIWSISVSVVTMTTASEASAGILAQSLQQFQAIHLRHVPIRQNQLYPAVSRFDDLQSLSAVGSLLNLIPELPQGPIEEHSDGP